MSLTNYSFTAIYDEDPDGKNSVAGQSVLVSVKGGGAANIFSDDAGLSPLPNPTVTDSNGVLSFYVNSGTYEITSGTRTEEINVTNSSEDFKNVTLSEMINWSGVDVGDAFIVSDLANGKWDAIAKGTTPNVDLPDGFYIRASVVDLTIAFRLRDGNFDTKAWGAAGDGVTNDTTAFSALRAASNGAYFINNGNYILDASPDVWDDPFSSSNSVTLTVAGVPFDASRCFAGQLKIGSTNDTIVNINGARSGEAIFRISDGSFSGQSHQSYLPWDIRRDSHSFIVAPSTNGGTCDHLFRRSSVNPDAFGNRYAFNFTESPDSGVTPDLWSITYATNDAGSPGFDVALTIQNGTTPEMKFPTMAPLFEQGFSTKRRTTGVFEYQHFTGVNDVTINDATTGNTLALYDSNGVTIAGKKSHIPSDTDIQATIGTHEMSGNISLTANTTDTYRLVASGSICAGTLRVVVESGGLVGFRHVAFQSDATTVTIQTIGVDNLPAQITANIVLNAGVLDLEISYTTGLSPTVKGTFTIEWDVRTF